jgi:hypothetical protein
MIVAAPAAGAWVSLVEPANSFRAFIAYNDGVIAEQVAKRVIGGAAPWFFRWKFFLLLLQQEPVKLVIFTPRDHQRAAAKDKPQNKSEMAIKRAFRHLSSINLRKSCRPVTASHIIGMRTDFSVFREYLPEACRRDGLPFVINTWG